MPSLLRPAVERPRDSAQLLCGDIADSDLAPHSMGSVWTDPSGVVFVCSETHGNKQQQATSNTKISVQSTCHSGEEDERVAMLVQSISLGSVE